MKDSNGVEVNIGDTLATKYARKGLSHHVVCEINDDEGVRFCDNGKVWIPPLYLARYWNVVSKESYVYEGSISISSTTEIALCDANGRSWNFDRRLADLIVLTDMTGSIRKATLIMGISYSYAWLRLKDLEERLGFDFFVREGPRGSYLTEEGRDFLNRYEMTYAEVESLGSRLVDERFQSFGFSA